VQNVALKRVHFGVINADQVLMARQQDAPVVAVFAAMQNSPRCIMVHESSGMKSFEQLQHVTLAVGAGQAFARFLRTHCDLSTVQIVPYTGSIAPFLNDPHLAQQAYVFSEPFLARRQGAQPHCLMVSQLGFNPYTSCLFTHEESIQSERQLVAKMVRASRRGWQEYLRAPEAVHPLIQKDNPQMDLESLKFAAEAIRALCLPEGTAESALGMMTEDRWRTLAAQLVELQFLDAGYDVSRAYTLQFLVNETGSEGR
jgi:NitT/TauT family transport system substrate-binding protein